MKIIHLSDTHLKKGKFDLFGLDPKKRLKLAIENINKHHSDADFLVVTGDLTDKGEVETYKALKDILEKSKVKVYTVLGNHDNRENYFKVFDNAFENKGFAQGSFIKEDKVFIFLDTLIPGTCSGDMCDIRFEWFEKELEKYTDKNIYLFMHHPPMNTGIYLMDIVGFESKERMKEILLKHKNIKHIFFGHVHRVISGVYAGKSFSCTRGTNHQVAYQFGKEELYFTNEEKAAYSIAEINGDDILINTHEYMDEDRVYLADYW
jgi:3',5'-cyclic AMP phosphodiesterase CpdA